MQHRQVEAAAVPRHELRRVFLDAVEEALDDLPSVSPFPPSDHTLNASRFAQRAGDRDDALQMQRQEIVADVWRRS